MKLQLLYFASLREALGCAGETLVLPDDIADVAGLRTCLAARGAAWEALTQPRIRVAVNQALADAGQALREGDEVAFFPPVTGG